MICKLQISLFPKDEPSMLIYNKDKSILYEDAATEDVIKLANGRPKLFVEAKLVDTKIQITKEVPWQDW